MSLVAQVQLHRGEFTLDTEFTVKDGEILAILGPNGAGKTSLLRGLAGLQSLDAGFVAVDDERLTDVSTGLARPAEQRRTGYVFQDYRLFGHLNALDNVGYGLRARRVSRSAARAAATDWLARLEIAEVARLRPSQLSGGQAQRVALARALIIEPRLVLLDEPLSALDAGARPTVRALLRRELRAAGVPSVVVTHEALEAMILADRLLVLEGGRVVQTGPVAEVARRPATPYVARLMGLNLYRGARTSTESVRIEGGGEIVVPRDAAAASAPQGLTPGGTVLVAARPSAITVHRTRPVDSSARNAWPARLAGLELLGDRVRLQTSGTLLPEALVDVTPDAVTELDLTPGAELWLSVKATDVDVYPGN